MPSRVRPQFRYPVPSRGGSDESDGSGSDGGGKSRGKREGGCSSRLRCQPGDPSPGLN